LRFPIPHLCIKCENDIRIPEHICVDTLYETRAMKFKSADGKTVLYAEKESQFVRFHLDTDGRVFGDQFSTLENFDMMIKREKWSEIKE
jgi:hypothetical protein